MGQGGLSPSRPGIGINVSQTWMRSAPHGFKEIPLVYRPDLFRRCLTRSAYFIAKTGGERNAEA